MERLLRTAVCAAALLALASGASAAIVGYTLTFSGSHNVPTVRLDNDSGFLSVTDFNMTIGDTAYNFDFYDNVSTSSGMTAAFNRPDTVNGGSRSNDLDVDLTGFGPARFLQFETDIDRDSANTVEDYRNVLFDLNGSGYSDNSLITVTFSDGSFLSGNLPDFPCNGNDTYAFSQSKKIIPEPSTLLLFAGGLAGAVAFRRRRRAR
jgi:hypothetical protein